MISDFEYHGYQKFIQPQKTHEADNHT